MRHLSRTGSEPTPSPADLFSFVVLLSLGGLYLTNLTGYLINDDEGSYLYAAWRVSLGEQPYRDFLTPQLPAFLLPGGWLMRLTGPDVMPARLLSVALALAAAVFFWAAVRHLLGSPAAAIAGASLLLQPDIFLDLRTFRPEPFMLLPAMAGLAAFAYGVVPRPGSVDPPRRRWLAVAGLLFGAASLAKLFGPFIMAGCLAWLLVDGWRRRRPWSAIVVDGAVVALAAGGVVAAGLGMFMVGGGDVYTDVVGHHLAQGHDLSARQVVDKGVAFFVDYARYHPIVVFVGLAAAVAVVRSGDRQSSLFAWQLPTALVFLGLSRQLFPRHLIYLVPAAVALVSGLAVALLRSRDSFAPVAAVGLVAALLFPWFRLDRDIGARSENGTRRVAALIDLLTEPNDVVLTDYSELNFYARRPTTYSAASLSAGAAQSGQITWQRMRDELGRMGRSPAVVLVDRAEVEGTSYGHLRFLQDLDAFEGWLRDDYTLVGRTVRRQEIPDREIFGVYLPKGQKLPTLASYENGPTLIAGGWPGLEGPLTSGGVLPVATVWGNGPASEPLALTVRFLDEAGREWAVHDEGLFATGAREADAWAPDELVAQVTRVNPGRGLPPGRYTVAVGPYRRSDAGPLTIRHRSVEPVGGLTPLGVVEVTGWQARAGAIFGTDNGLRAVGEALGGLELVAASPLPENVAPGETLHLDLWWHVDSPVEEGQRLRVTLGDRTLGTVAADAQTVFGRTADGAPAWPPGVNVRQPVDLTVSAGASAADYELILTPLDSDGAPVDGAVPAVLGALAVSEPPPRTAETTLPALSRRLDAALGEYVELVGVILPATAAAGGSDPGAGPRPPLLTAEPGGAVDVELVWRAKAAVPSRYKVTVQVEGSEGQPLAQSDSEPADWTRPTTSWLPGEVVRDRHHLEIPADVAPGSYRVVAAMYDPQTGDRLPVAGDGDAVDVASLLVGAPPEAPSGARDAGDAP